MMRLSGGTSRRDLASAAAGAVLATVLAGGVAWAAIPDGGGVINGCYQKNQGQLRVIDPGVDACRSPEVPIAWNARGVKGDQGDPGEPGVPGTPGRDGRDGLDGRNGTSVTVEPEAPGANCSMGGAKIRAGDGVAYVCSALPPDPGPD